MSTAGRPTADSQALVEMLESLVATAGRAPSVHNTQPWRFRVRGDALELRADLGRRLSHADPSGRELLISCGAALFGLRVAVRLHGRRPVVELLPAKSQPDLLARVRLGAPVAPGADAHRLQAALRRRHTHRGPFADSPSAGLLAALQRDAEAEAARLVVVHDPRHHERLTVLSAVADRRQREHPALRQEVRSWTRPPGSPARDGVPARAVPRQVGNTGTLAQRDFDLGRGWGTLVTEPGEAATAALITSGDTPKDWLHAGQALHRLLLRAADDWVFARLHTQAVEVTPVRATLRTQLRLPGALQMVLQLGHAGYAPLTPRRAVGELLAR